MRLIANDEFKRGQTMFLLGIRDDLYGLIRRENDAHFIRDYNACALR